MLQGGQESLPWRETLNTKDHPAFKGPGGNALAWKELIAVPENMRLVQIVVSSIFGSAATATAVAFCLGALTYFPPTAVPCAAFAAIPAFIAAVVFSPDLINLVGRYFQRNDAMNNGHWFVWSSGAGFFNGFGDVDQSWINPSLFTAGDRQQIRVGVVFGNVLLNQGPDFDLSRVGAAETQTPRSRRLGALVRRMERSKGRTRTGSRRGERLFGGARDDYLFAAAGHDSVFGRRGNDVLLQGARGNDRILGGPGNDNIDGHRGGDVLSGGPGNDQLVDFFGHTTVRTGPGNDLVAVRDGRGGDTVVCRGPGRKRILADPSDRIVKAGSGVSGRAACPPGTRIITTGPLPRHGKGY
jgi:hemolysin type calcium-binding protein